MILIVDDDKAVRMSLELMLTRASFECHAVSTEKDALDAVRTQNIELIILDMNLSLTTTGREGMEMLRKIHILVPDVPVILITAWGTIPLAVDGMNHGAVDFVTKPWNNTDLLAKIRKALAYVRQLKDRKVPTLEEVERRAVVEALDRCNGNLSSAAQLLGITRQALYRRIEKFNIPPTTDESTDIFHHPANTCGGNSHCMVSKCRMGMDDCRFCANCGGSDFVLPVSGDSAECRAKWHLSPA